MMMITLEDIKKNCEKQDSCKKCPFYPNDDEYTESCYLNEAPSMWNIRLLSQLWEKNLEKRL